jgi:hypothetical protein
MWKDKQQGLQLARGSHQSASARAQLREAALSFAAA